MDKMLLTKDTYEYLINFADDRTIINMLLTNKKFAKKFEDERFFEALLKKRYPFLLAFKKEDESFKNFYIKEIFYISKIEEKCRIPYYQVKDYNPEDIYKQESHSAYMHINVIHIILDYAVASGNINVIKDIIDKYEINVRWRNIILLEAAENGHLEIVKFLLSKGATTKYSALSEATIGGHLDVVKYLIETYNLNANEAIELAREHDHEEILRYLETRENL